MLDLLRKPHKKQERGATLVEGALTIAITLMIIFSILEFGRAFGIYQTITDAAREGARYASQPCPSTATNAIDCNGAVISCTSGTSLSTAQVQACTQRYVDGASVRGTTISVTTQTNTVNGVALNYRSVQVSAPYQFLYFPFGTITMNGHSVMRDEIN